MLDRKLCEAIRASMLDDKPDDEQCVCTDSCRYDDELINLDRRYRPRRRYRLTYEEVLIEVGWM
ncbi:MAG: hypothetical protein K5859_03565 [Atopobiaceae bacterium]|nr:hypothetical protein [Atopobiaceae bacterium]